MECLHGGVDSHLYPVGLDMGEVVQEQARYGHRTQDVFFAGDVRDNPVEGVVFRVVNQGDEGEKSGGFVLQVAEHLHVGDSVFGLFDVAKEHGGVGGNSQLVGCPVHRKPFLASFFTRADLVPDALHQDFGAASGEGVKACLFQRRHDLLGTLSRDFREVADFYGGEGLQVHLRKFPAEFREHVDVVVEGMVRMETAYDVEFPRSLADGLGGLCPDGAVVPVVGGGAVLLDFGEGTELAVQNANIGVVNLSVIDPIDGFSVAAFLFGVCTGAEFRQGGVVEKVQGFGFCNTGHGYRYFNASGMRAAASALSPRFS